MRRLVVVAGLALAAGLLPAPAAAAEPFVAGAASVDITPPAWTAASDAAFTPACGPTPAAVAQAWPGARQFQFEEPYVDLGGRGRWEPGDPFCDANHDGRYDAPWLAGGSGANRWPKQADTGNPVSAQAIVLGLGPQRLAVVTVDSIGLFNVTMDAIRAAARRTAPRVGQVFISSTHDESAPDPIGLWGPDPSDLPGNPGTPAALASGYDPAYFDWMTARVASAIARADGAARPAQLRAATGQMAADLQSCWSSYPFTDVQLDTAVQAVDATTGGAIFTLVNHSTHAETLAFSGADAYTSLLSSDWPGPMRVELERAFGGVAVEMTGLIGSVETPNLYEPESTQVVNVPGTLHDVAGNPDGCRSVYPNPATGTPVTDAHQFLAAYGQTVAHAAERLLASAETFTPSTLSGRDRSFCVQMENHFFLAAFAAGLFPQRPAYTDPTCSVALPGTTMPAPAYHLPPGQRYLPSAAWVKSDVAVVTAGPLQIAYSPGEVFPFTEVRGPIDQARMPFPTDCYNPATEDYGCGSPLPMTPWISARMPARYRVMAGLGQDMIGYLFPPGNFVGDQGEVAEQPWAAYQLKHAGATDRFGYHHSDDSESLGPHAGLTVTEQLAALLPNNPGILPGLYVDAAGHTSVSPFPSPGFSGATGVVVVDHGRRETLAGHWMTFDGTPDAGTAGTSYPYSVSTAGVILADGRAVYVDVFAGAPPPPA